MRNLREIIPAVLVLAFIVLVAGLVLELTIAAVKGQPTDPIATTVLGSIAGACVTALVPLYLRESRPPPGPPPESRPLRIEETGDEESDRWNRERGWLEMRRWVPRWARS